MTADYVHAFGAPFDEATDRLVESRISSTRRGRDELEDLVGSAPTHVRAGMKRRLALHHRLLEEDQAYTQRAAAIGAVALAACHPAIERTEQLG